jgi:hypothetical protein
MVLQVMFLAVREFGPEDNDTWLSATTNCSTSKTASRHPVWAVSIGVPAQRCTVDLQVVVGGPASRTRNRVFRKDAERAVRAAFGVRPAAPGEAFAIAVTTQAARTLMVHTVSATKTTETAKKSAASIDWNSQYRSAD